MKSCERSRNSRSRERGETSFRRLTQVVVLLLGAGIGSASSIITAAASATPVDGHSELPSSSGVGELGSSDRLDGLGYPIQMVRLDSDRNNVVRSGPGPNFSIVEVFRKGRTFEVIAKHEEWYNIRLSDLETGWIHSSLCKEFDDLSGLELRPNPRLYSRIGSFVLTGYAGGYSFDRKSNSLAVGGRFGYYVLDFLEVEGGVSWTRVHRPQEIVESLFDLELEPEEFHMLFYQFNTILELLPGRRMVPYLTAGVGSTIMQGETESSFNYGAGTLLFVGKRTATRWELRKYQFDSGFSRARRTNHNIEFSFGTSLLF